MAVIIREKKLKKGKISLYLDIYTGKNINTGRSNKREYEFLKLYLIGKPKDQIERNFNKDVRRKANALRAKKEIALINTGAVMKDNNVFFIDYFKTMVDGKVGSPGNYAIWNSTYKILIEYFKGNDIKVADIDNQVVEEIKNHFLNIYRTKAKDTLNKKNLNKNTASLYFSKVKACLNQAFKTQITINKFSSISIKPDKSSKAYLTIEELKSIEFVDCEVPILKNAFLFSIYTGLRWSDVYNLKWDNLVRDGQKYKLNYQQQKTKKNIDARIADKALTFIGEIKNGSDRIFYGLKYGTYYNKKLKEWLEKAGIHRKITFHCARHTYATTLLTKEIDIYTVSKLLGHSDLRMTEIYANLVDKRKQDAANVLDDL